jgi:hypothetical protein
MQLLMPDVAFAAQAAAQATYDVRGADDQNLGVS